MVGDVLYQASGDAAVDEVAAVDGRLVRTRVYSPVWARAVSRAIAVFGWLGFLLAGLVFGWAFRATSRRAVETAGTRPGRTALVGAGVLVLLPLSVIPLSLTLGNRLRAWVCERRRPSSGTAASPTAGGPHSSKSEVGFWRTALRGAGSTMDQKIT